MVFFNSTMLDTKAKFDFRKEQKRVTTIATIAVVITAIGTRNFLILVFAIALAFSCHQSSLCIS